MRKAVYFGLGLLVSAPALGVGATFAADLGQYGYKDDVSAPAPLWRGFYFGLNAGGLVEGESDFTFNPGGPPAANQTNKVDAKGIAGGFQLGYNAQFGAFVVGVEGDADFAKTDVPTQATFLGGVAETQVNQLYSTRGRLGVTLRPDVLAYGTGGFALTDIDHSLDFGGELHKDSAIIGGVVYGGGFEYLLSSRVSFGLEALHYDFGKERFNLNVTLPNAVQSNIPTDIDTSFTTVRGRVSLHLN